MIDVFKLETNKSFKESTNEQRKEMNKIIQDLKVEIKSIKKTHTEEN